MLHLLRTTCQSKLTGMLNTLVKGDIIVLIDDGSYLLTSSLLESASDLVNSFYIIEEHALARGIKVSAPHKAINNQELISLVFAQNNTITWQ